VSVTGRSAASGAVREHFRAEVPRFACSRLQKAEAWDKRPPTEALAACHALAFATI
jgi:hypothetical protein